MAKPRTSEAADDQGHAPAFVNETIHKVPRCVKCGIEQPGARTLWIMCDGCRETSLAADEASFRAHQGKPIDPKYRQADRLVPEYIPEVLTPKAIAARNRIGILGVTASESARSEPPAPQEGGEKRKEDA